MTVDIVEFLRNEARRVKFAKPEQTRYWEAADEIQKLRNEIIQGVYSRSLSIQESS